MDVNLCFVKFSYLPGKGAASCGVGDDPAHTASPDLTPYQAQVSGSSSQPDIKISSSIAVNVTDLKHKIFGLEQQLNQASKHCSELACFESISKNSGSSVPTELKHNKGNHRELIVAPPEKKSTGAETKVLYKTSESHYRQSDDSDYRPKTCDDTNEVQINKINFELYGARNAKVKKKKAKLSDGLNDCSSNFRRRNTRSVYENFASAYSTSSFHSLADERMAHYSNVGLSDRYRDRKQFKREYTETPHKDQTYRDQIKQMIDQQKHAKNKKNTHVNHQLDQDFIADIIRRQYQPVKMFGRKESDVSQFSAPVCRDQEFLLHENIQEDSELCSCCYDGEGRANNRRHTKLCDMRSICDTRLYSSKKTSRPKHRRRRAEVYNNSDLYDLIPVKEKSSPKSRRKFAEDNITGYDYYKQVPPSPRTLRPRLNLKAQYYAEFEDYMTRVKHCNRRRSPSRTEKHQEFRENLETDLSSEIAQNRYYRHQQKHLHENIIQVPKEEIMHQDTGTMSSLQYPNFVNAQGAAVNTSLNKTQDTDLSGDKTDKALCEIKDILQSFLIEIKKDSTSSQCNKSDVTGRIAHNGTSNIQHASTNMNTNILPNSGHSFNNYGMAQCSMPPFMPNFSNPCCYPVVPMCPMNCMQNGYVIPSPSFTCATCGINKEPVSNEPNKPSNSKNNAVNELHNPETEQLIKEIYKHVAQSPRTRQNERCDGKDYQKEPRIMTSRSAGGSTMTSKHDAKVGTPRMKCFSKSCEAISPKIISDTYYNGTNATYSDTILERLSLEATPTDSISETDFTHTSTSVEKGNGNRFAKVLRSFGFLKKKKRKDIIEELSESESTVEVEVKPKPRSMPKPPPFRQDVTNYIMHGQEYYHQPPVPPLLMPPYQQQPPDYHGFHRSYNPGIMEYSQHLPDPRNPHGVHQHTIQEQDTLHYHPDQRPTAPPYSNPYDKYNPMQQQVPLCLKEIEVKSIGTQSERKISFFRKMKTKMQPPEHPTVRCDEYLHRNCSTQTAQDKPGLFSLKNLQNKPMNKPDQGIFSFKNMQSKSMNNNTDPMAFSYWKQKQLAEGDIKMRNVMLKKLFYKRNPFSPRNLIVRTLLGKDKSSYGEPPTQYKARMFL